MAYIVEQKAPSIVMGSGSAMAVGVKMSASMIDMIASSYTYLLLAAIREPIQNAVDEARRSGLEPEEAVIVTLPTEDNPVLSVVDLGSGMTKEFMTSSYLVLGESTKAEDRGVAGGIGIGRWAGYAYCKECYISTCHASDMMRRTYFQFQSAEGMPVVQEMSAVEGTQTGTTVSFPVKPDDFNQAKLTVAWLREIMQITMGFSFKVVGAIPSLIQTPEICLDLGSVDLSLSGVKVYLTHEDCLQYGFNERTQGSVIVLTNKEKGTGGLPFHVRSSNTNSVFHKGCIVEIPMTFNVTFMPSREEVKYEPMADLMARIDKAAFQAASNLAKSLYRDHSCKSLKLLQSLTTSRTCFAKLSNGAFHTAVIKELGPDYDIELGSGYSFRGPIPHDVSIRYVNCYGGKTVQCPDGFLRTRNGEDMVLLRANPWAVTIFCVDSKGGLPAARKYIQEKNLHYCLVVSGTDKASVIKMTEHLNAQYKNEIKVIYTSSIPAKVTTRRVASSVAKSVKIASIQTYNTSLSKQDVVHGTVLDYFKEDVLPFVVKDSSSLMGFIHGTSFSSFEDYGTYSSSMANALSYLNIPRVFILTKTQYKNIMEAKQEYIDNGMWDAPEEELDSADVAIISTLRKWTPFENLMANIAQFSEIRLDYENREKATVLTSDYNFSAFISALNHAKPFILKGTKVDKALTQYGDWLVGEAKLVKGVNNAEVSLFRLCEKLGNQLDDSVSPEAADTKNALLEFSKLGVLDYRAEFAELVKNFPLIALTPSISLLKDSDYKDFFDALALLYK